MTTPASDFLGLAVREASRYGGEDMVFLRELLQNARDAGARRVVIETTVSEGIEAIMVTDDGMGMSWDHAQRFLLKLYASSKRGASETAGRFGVGFWSILRFEPTEISIASRVEGITNGWEIVFGPGLDILKRGSTRMPVGTSVRLERPARPGDLAASVWTLIRRDARYLRSLGSSSSVMEVVVDGRQATEEMVAGKPGFAFRRKGLRGTISLGPSPEVVVLAHGLRVRSAASIDELLLRPARRLQRSGWTPTSGLSPRIVVDSDRLAVLMDRGDVAQNRALESVVRVLRSETRRLCLMELDRLAPRSVWRRMWDGVHGRRRVLGVGIVVLAVLAVALWVGRTLGNGEPRLTSAGRPAENRDAPRPYVDRASSYGGPVTQSIDGVGEGPDLSYRPTDQRLFLAAFRVLGIDEEGRPMTGDLSVRDAGGNNMGARSTLEIDVGFSATGTLLRLPVPTGHVVDSSSVRLNGRQVGLGLTVVDEPVVRLDSEDSGRVQYRTREQAAPMEGAGEWPALPPAVSLKAVGLRGLPPPRRVEAAIELVRSSLARPDANTAGIPGFFGPVYEARGGDCDVVNTVLAAVLSDAGLQSRLAVGWIGVDGEPIPGLHAWVEVDLGEGRWVPADASIPVHPTTDVIRDRDLDGNEEGISQPESGSGEVPKAVVLWGFGLLAAILGTSVVVGVRRLRVTREFRAPADLDPGALVESLIRDGEAWPGFREARRRRLIPSLADERHSLAQIEAAARRSALFVAHSQGSWVERVRDGGGLVIDGGTRAGRAAADAFGAFDLDRWQDLWVRSAPTPLTEAVETALRRSGLDLKLRFADGVPGGDLGLMLNDGARAWVVCVGIEGPPGIGNSDCGPGKVFWAADRAVETLGSGAVQAQRALAAVARENLVAMGLDGDDHR